MNALAENALQAAATTSINDLADDFIEQELGSNFFPKTWENLKTTGTAVAKIAAWLADVGIEAPCAQEIADQIDVRAQSHRSWITPFSKKP